MDPILRDAACLGQSAGKQVFGNIYADEALFMERQFGPMVMWIAP